MYVYVYAYTIYNTFKLKFFDEMLIKIMLESFCVNLLVIIRSAQRQTHFKHFLFYVWCMYTVHMYMYTKRRKIKTADCDNIPHQRYLKMRPGSRMKFSLKTIYCSKFCGWFVINVWYVLHTQIHKASLPYTSFLTINLWMIKCVQLH